jgi:hypothetical protein
MLPDAIASRPELDTPAESFQRLVLDFEDLVDWAAELAPQVRRVRDVSQAPQLGSVGLAALLAVGALLLMTRARL